MRYQASQPLRTLPNSRALRIMPSSPRSAAMPRLTLILATVITMAALPASAECFADYKAKQDDPLRLHYGVAQVSDAACTGGSDAGAEIALRLAGDGWQLLNVLSVFGPEGLEERRSSAGEYFLRF
jgi:uncharacterized membrane protein